MRFFHHVKNYLHFLYENTCAESFHHLSLQSLCEKIEVIFGQGDENWNDLGWAFGPGLNKVL